MPSRPGNTSRCAWTIPGVGAMEKVNVFRPDNPAGTVHCSLLDYLKFADLHTSLGSRGPHLLRPVSIARLHEPPKGTDYAFGWWVRNPGWARGRALTHGGSNTRNQFQVWIAPIVDLCLAVATNSSTFQQDENGKWDGSEKTGKLLGGIAEKIAQQFAA